MKIIFQILFFLLTVCLHAQNEMFRGGFADGYGKIGLLDPTNMIANGATSDGYSLGQVHNLETLICTGGFADGYTKGDISNSTFLASRGGYDDGYASQSWIRKYWTGEINFNWNNGVNWSDAVVPNSNDEVIIPAGRPFYPILSGQFFHIGQLGISSDYNCKSIWIQKNATLTGSTSTYLENNNILTIDGQLFWKNVEMNSVYNKPGALIQIGITGLLQVQN